MIKILEIDCLKKTFSNNHSVINGLSLSVESGEIYGLIGQNGAGKTTTMMMVLGQLIPDSGQIKISGKVVQPGGETTNSLVGYAPDVPSFYGYMTAKEYLTFCGEITKMAKPTLTDKIDQLLKKVGLDGQDKIKISQYSRGMKQRLGIAQALLNEPALLICDEPTSALDPKGRKEVVDLLLTLKDEMAIILSTHILSDVEKICDRVGILSEGVLVKEGRVKDLLASHQGNQKLIITFDHLDEFNRFKTDQSFTISHLDIASLAITVEDEMSKLLSKLTTGHYTPEKIMKEQQTLEAIFMEVVQ